MKKTARNTMYKEPTDNLDWSYVELQEHDFLLNQNEEFFYPFKEERE